MNKHVNKSKQVNNSSLGHGIEESEYICCICGEIYKGFGNNPAPVKYKGRCCNHCNNSVVIPTRIKMYLDMLNNQNGVK